MKTTVLWKDDMMFDGQMNDHHIPMDAKAPLGKERGPTPKELVAMGLGGCTAMDVIALLKKNKQLPEHFSVDVEIQQTQGTHPVVFQSALLTYTVRGSVTAETLLEAVGLSQTRYCGVSAMIAKTTPIEYKVILNDVEIGSGLAKFN